MLSQSPAYLSLLGALAIHGVLSAQTRPAIPAGSRVVEVITRDFAFGMPDTLVAGMTTFRLRNEGPSPHHLMLYRLDAGKTLSDAFQALQAGGSHPGWMHAAGGPNAVPRGREAVGTVMLEPGTYVAFCHVKSPDQVIHFAKGMMRAVRVVPAADPALNDWPEADLTVTLREYTFSWSHPPARGWQRIAVRNLGQQRHELILSRLAQGKSTEDFIRWMNSQQGPPPAVPWGGITDLPAGGTMLIDVYFEPGPYATLCRVRDAGNGRPHDEHGMYAQITVP